MEVVYSKSFIKITTVSSITPEKNPDVTISEQNETSLKTLFKIIIGEQKHLIEVLWSHFSSDAAINFHWNENDLILFVGGGCVSAVIDVASNKVIDINYPDLFWGWKIHNSNILELGELECRLFSPTGKCIGSTCVDPPFEYVDTGRSIEFSSIVVGKTRIDY